MSQRDRCHEFGPVGAGKYPDLATIQPTGDHSHAKGKQKGHSHDQAQVLTTLGIGQALITVLNEKGIPTEVVATHLVPPRSVMGPLTTADYENHVRSSDVYKKYKDPIDPESAYEILSKRMEATAKAEEEQETAKEVAKVAAKGTPRGSAKEEKGMFEEALASPLVKQIGRDVVRGVFGMLFGKTTTTRKRSGGLFGF